MPGFTRVLQSALRLAAVGIVAALVACDPGPPGRFVVLVVMDTVRRDALGCYGNDRGTTPGIDALAADGVRFDRAVSSSGWTLPAVASLLTGTWPSIHGALGRGTQLTPLRPEVATAAEVMKAAGFNTAGYANAAFVSPKLGLDRGFDVFDHVYMYNQSTRRADETMDAAIEYTRVHRGEDCFIMIHLFDPHLDYDPPAGYATRFTGGRTEPAPPLSIETCLALGEGEAAPDSADVDYIRGVYLGEVAFMDAQIERFANELKARGLYDRALIVVTADHGEEFWDHDGFEHGHTLYDELVGVPLVVKFPADLHPTTRRVAWQVRVLDVMPTVFDYLGVEAPESFRGESLLSYVRGEPDGHRDSLSESLLYGTRRVAWRTGRYTYIQDIEEGRDEVGELFDWKADPFERTDLSEERAEIAAEIRGECMEFYHDLLVEAKSMSSIEPINMSPEEIDKLKSLGYVR